MGVRACRPAGPSMGARCDDNEGTRAARLERQNESRAGEGCRPMDGRKLAKLSGRARRALHEEPSVVRSDAMAPDDVSSAVWLGHFQDRFDPWRDNNRRWAHRAYRWRQALRILDAR